MNTARKRVLIVLGGLILILIIGVAAFILTFDINSYGRRIEAAASEATGLDVRIKGKMHLSISPPGILAKDIHVYSGQEEFLSVKYLKLGMDLIQLLKRQLNVKSCELFDPVITVVKETDGRYNFEGAKRKIQKEEKGASLHLDDLKLYKGALLYLDKKTGQRTEFNDLKAVIRDLSIPDISKNIAQNASYSADVSCNEVRRKDMRIDNLHASVRTSKDVYQFEPLVIGAIDYTDGKTKEKTEFRKLKLSIKDFAFDGSSGQMITDISFTGGLECREVKKKKIRIDEVSSSIEAEKGVIRFTSLSMGIFGAKAEGSVTVDEAGRNAVYKIDLKIPEMDFEKLQESLGSKNVVGGKGDLTASLTVRDEGRQSLMDSVNGTFSLRGNNLPVYVMDLDRLLSSYETSQEFNLVDLGAYFVAGPLSTLAIKGYRYGDLYNQSRGGRSVITKFSSHWRIRNGVADAVDCALATRRNRVALKGRLNLVTEQYDNVVVAILDEKGCAKFKQGISGSFESPRTGSVSAIQTLTGPITNLLKKAGRILQGGKCEVFYSGSVAQPK